MVCIVSMKEAPKEETWWSLTSQYQWCQRQQSTSALAQFQHKHLMGGQYLCRHFSTDLFLCLSQAFLGQFCSPITLCDEGFQVIHRLRVQTKNCE